MRTGAGAAFVGVVVVLAGLFGTAAPAHAAVSPSYVTMFSDSGDWVGGGVRREFDSSNAQIEIYGTPAYLTVGISGGSQGDYFEMDFAGPPGHDLVSGGVYTGAERASFREYGHAGIDIWGDGRGCNNDTGLFEVKDIAIDGTGAISRLWIVYEQHCEGGMPALWGEIKIGEPVSGSPLVAPGIVRWPATDVGAPNTVVPVTVKALSATATVSAASITGADASDFDVRADECTGTSLAVGGSCQVWVRFVPTVAGTRLATLRVTEANGATHDIALQGFAYGGVTRVDMTSDAGDYIGQGKTWSYTLANADISMGGSRDGIFFGVNGANGDWWGADFVPGQGDIIAAGSTYDATRYPFNGSGPGMDVSGMGRGCNTLTGSFTVTSAKFGPDGVLESAAVSFVQHCEGATPALRGTFQFRAGDNTPAAPWMVSSLPTEPAPRAIPDAQQPSLPTPVAPRPRP